jgi:hypothetical protein
MDQGVRFVELAFRKVIIRVVLTMSAFNELRTTFTPFEHFRS